MAYTFEQSYYFRPYRGNSSFWLNRYGNGSIASHQKATLYTAAGSADQRLKVHKVSGGCQLLSDLNNAYGLNIYGVRYRLWLIILIRYRLLAASTVKRSIKASLKLPETG